MSIKERVNAAVNVANTDSVYTGIRRQTSLHKALDFSNIGIPEGTIDGAKAGDERYLRQFHQTRIFVTGFNAMRHHDEYFGSTTYLISANLPDKLKYGVGSKWEQPLSSFGNAHTNALMQLGSALGNATGWLPNSGVSGINRATTMKIWGGSEPLKLQLTIPVVDDNYGTNSAGGISTNFVEALEFLGCLCLPSRPAELGFYKPPPSPLGIDIKLTSQKTVGITNPTSGRIMVQLGGILLIDNCLIEKIDVDYPNTKTQIKHTYSQNSVGSSGSSYLTPLLASITITLTTVEAMTSEIFSKMLWLKPQAMGKGSADFSYFGDKITAMLGGGQNKENKQ